MRVFVTGATGFIGQAVVGDLLQAGHQVTGLARSAEGAAALEAAGAVARRGDVDDLDGLKLAAGAADGVVHLAFNHDFSRYVENCEADRAVIQALGMALAGSGRPLLITSGTAMTGPTLGRAATEDDPPLPASLAPRAASEEAARGAAANGANVGVVRLPQVHDARRQGFVTYAVALAQQTGVSAYVADGANRWPAAPVADVARLYRLALERGSPGAVYNAVAEEGVPVRAIAEAIGRQLGVGVRSIAPEAAAEHFGWLASFAGADTPASSKKTQAALGWTPTGPTLLQDLERLELAA